VAAAMILKCHNRSGNGQIRIEESEPELRRQQSEGWTFPGKRGDFHG
jgi:hypothetical protein